MSTDELKVRLRARPLQEPILLRQKEAVVPQRCLEVPLLVREKGLSVPERVLAKAVQLLGHAYPPEFPQLLTGPTATPSLTTCIIAWTVDIAAYHRVRYKLYGAPTWTVSAWSALATTSASVTLTGLAGERTRYEYEIQSDLDKTGKTEGWWSGAWTFYTTCNNSMTISLGDIDNNEGATLWVNWLTNTKSYGSIRWREYPGGTWNAWSPYDVTYTKYHYMQFIPFIYDGNHSKVYYVQFRAKNACDFVFTFPRTYILEWSIAEGMWIIY